ncbi:hypothetical protein BJ508DRAFT_305985 [Ascobolus immersus RN42]|uniref:Uncharacterized protein n=1 Tax=Ascobolus immersus RN42 TaxID=1160509 RepID=A0A3N4I9E0_ASCIM|nr:hypothetical protein BJ508DRAFT_305985 [Ascobolus immersus RN42]
MARSTYTIKATTHATGQLERLNKSLNDDKKVDWEVLRDLLDYAVQMLAPESREGVKLVTVGDLIHATRTKITTGDRTTVDAPHITAYINVGKHSKKVCHSFHLYVYASWNEKVQGYYPIPLSEAPHTISMSLSTIGTLTEKERKREKEEREREHEATSTKAMKNMESAGYVYRSNKPGKQPAGFWILEKR